MEANNQPLVSVPVITYNSAKYVLETLESIKAQTYQNIELIISDDCSTDSTVELCQQWINKNKERFVRTELITIDINTGVSANLNRAEAACQGEWVKPMAGDDLLLPTCIDNCINYVDATPNVVYLFAKIEAFGTNEKRNKYFTDKVFDYSFFDLDINEQLERLVFGDNCIPASTCFYNRRKVLELGITNDERIPLLEDWPKWINVLNRGIKLYFMNQLIVKYRIHEESLSTHSRASSRLMFSDYLFTLYYRYPKWVERNEDEAINRMANSFMMMYEELLKIEKHYNQLRSSHAYRIGKIILKPMSFFRYILNR